MHRTVHNGGLLTCVAKRFMLGTFDAGLFPCVNYYLSWCVTRTFLPVAPSVVDVLLTG
ncbi:hypothetical protein C8Q80DRAFT_246051 [Daedaleopsis nitida]|nr:hypothetical protein C8Q80DRAFT_246051 [Daedaleopsis nitida]